MNQIKSKLDVLLYNQTNMSKRRLKNLSSYSGNKTLAVRSYLAYFVKNQVVTNPPAGNK